MLTKKRCSCGGLNPNCCRCDGWGYLTVEIRGYAKNLAIPPHEIDLVSVARGHERNDDAKRAHQKAVQKQVKKTNYLQTVRCFVCDRVVERGKVYEHLLRCHNMITEKTKKNGKRIFKINPKSNKKIVLTRWDKYLKTN